MEKRCRQAHRTEDSRRHRESRRRTPEESGCGRREVRPSEAGAGERRTAPRVETRAAPQSSAEPAERPGRFRRGSWRPATGKTGRTDDAGQPGIRRGQGRCGNRPARVQQENEDRKSTRLNSSHEWISYAVFCLKKKTNKDKN